jgi:tetratricopeptide (TPR) repeat protein
LIAQPGSAFIYSNYGYNLLGAAIETASGMTIGEYLKREIFEPFGMISTQFKDPDKIVLNRARGYRLSNGELVNSEFLDPSLAFASGGIESTVMDLIRFSRGLEENIVLSKITQEIMYNSMITSDGRDTRYGMGWNTGFYHGYWMISMTGWMDGTSTLLWRFPWSNFALAICSNLEGVQLGNLAEYIVSQFLLTSNSAPVTKPENYTQVSRSLWNLFIHGLSYYDRYKCQAKQDTASIAEAFNNLNTYLKTKLQSNSSDYPQQQYKKDMIIAGSFIVGILERHYDEEKLDYYRAANFFALFDDYYDLYTNKESLPESFHFDSEIEQLIHNWNKCWKEVFTDEVRYLLELQDYEYTTCNLPAKILALFSEKEIYPHFWKLNDYASELISEGKTNLALKTIEVIIELYPWDVSSYRLAGRCYEDLGDKDNALKYYKFALERQPDSKYLLQKVRELSQK